ncbi:MAG: hypothetical protein E7483_05625 [Ruminococcaceae bacterium]|nr:hypothetical protein [Oscillospiraceae bacterium]
MDNVVFKQSVMGFNRTQVLEYIDTLVKQLKDREEEYAQKQHNLQQEIDALTLKCEESKNDLTLTVDKIKELSVELEYFKNNNAELKSQIDYYKNLLLTKDGELINLKKDNFSLKTKCELLHAENDSWKKRQDKIGECLIEAQIKADEIIASAHQQAEETKKSMEVQAAKLSKDVVDLKSEIARVEEQLEQSFAKLQKAMETMDSSARTIEEQVENYKNKVEEIDTSVPKVKTEKQPVSKKSSQHTIGTYAVKAKPAKKSLSDSVLDTIAKIIG